MSFKHAHLLAFTSLSAILAAAPAAAQEAQDVSVECSLEGDGVSIGLGEVSLTGGSTGSKSGVIGTPTDDHGFTPDIEAASSAPGAPEPQVLNTAAPGSKPQASTGSAVKSVLATSTSTTKKTASNTASSSSGGNKPYITNPSISSMGGWTGSSKSAAGGTVHYSRYNGGTANKQNLAAVKTYPTPSGNGTVITIGGQKILAKGTVKTAGLNSNIIAIIDEINLTAAALGLPDPVLTAGTDGQHSSGSLHYSGKALDIRCNHLSDTQCKKWVMTLGAALGRPPYDVFFEGYGNENDHIHIEYEG